MAWNLFFKEHNLKYPGQHWKKAAGTERVWKEKLSIVSQVQIFFDTIPVTLTITAPILLSTKRQYEV